MVSSAGLHNCTAAAVDDGSRTQWGGTQLDLGLEAMASLRRKRWASVKTAKHTTDCLGYTRTEAPHPVGTERLGPS